MERMDSDRNVLCVFGNGKPNMRKYVLSEAKSIPVQAFQSHPEQSME